MLNMQSARFDEFLQENQFARGGCWHSLKNVVSHGRARLRFFIQRGLLWYNSLAGQRLSLR